MHRVRPTLVATNLSLKRTELRACAPAYTFTHPTPPILPLVTAPFFSPPDLHQSFSTKGPHGTSFWGKGRGRITDRTDVVLCCVSSAVFYSLDRGVEELLKV